MAEGVLEVLKELALEVITPDRAHLPLLDLLGRWATDAEDLPEEKRREVTDAVESATTSSGVRLVEEPSIFRFLNALESKARREPCAPTPVQDPNKRITSKRALDELPLSEAEQKRSKAAE
mmetsp:Transcript_36252/g.82124  ORF Transcript_36252/g.82124 Transcript_36252/m.82124 type:complete len:121 (+) Transcript_36252:42-404(+)